jgi:hypothetical protein
MGVPNEVTSDDDRASQSEVIQATIKHNVSADEPSWGFVGENEALKPSKWVTNPHDVADVVNPSSQANQ